jgi:aminoglycoside phosphotransferase (APT) family kinase protein
MPGMTQSQSPPPPEADFHLQRSSRDATDVPEALARWLATVLPEGANPVVTLGGDLDANGMSSETLLVDVTWIVGGHRQDGRFVARVAPAAEDLPVFASYRLEDQFEAIRLVGELTDVAVPQVRWMEPTGLVLGTPFFLMDRVDGLVPPDVLPYNFGDNWLFDATADQQRRLQDATVGVLAQLHAIPGSAQSFAFLDLDLAGTTPLERHLTRTRDWYEYAVAAIGRSPLIDRGLRWLEANVPVAEENVLCWGDSRIGNVMYDDFTPVGVLDWEMASLGPRELDVAWMVFAHRVFEHLTTTFEMPGMPDFLREVDVRATYAELAGVELGELGWFQVYAAVQWGIVFMRTGARQLHFGEIEMPAEVDALFHHRGLLEKLLDENGAA